MLHHNKSAWLQTDSSSYISSIQSTPTIIEQFETRCHEFITSDKHLISYINLYTDFIF